MTTLAQDVEDLNAGKITYSEFQEREYLRTQAALTPRLIECMDRQDWEGYIALTLSHFEVMPIAFKHFSLIPDDLKYEFAVKAYMHHGDSIPAVRQAVRSALKYGKPTIPEEIATADEVIVYRAGEEPIGKAKYRISWTTDKAVAEWFLREYSGRHASHLYAGKIKPGKIIAFRNDRNEREIMQYGAVYDIREL